MTKRTREHGKVMKKNMKKYDTRKSKLKLKKLINHIKDFASLAYSITLYIYIGIYFVIILPIIIIHKLALSEIVHNGQKYNVNIKNVIRVGCENGDKIKEVSTLLKNLIYYINLSKNL
jgi:hypothetical protein